MDMLRVLNPLKSVFRTKKAAKTPVRNHVNDLDYKILTGQLTELSEIRMTASQLQERRTAYNAMCQLQQDAIMGPTFEVYATNATTTNLAGDVIWAEPTNPDDPMSVIAAKAANERIAAWELNWRAYKHILELITHGNLYLKTTEYMKPVDNNTVINLNERNPNRHWDLLPGSAIEPGDIYELAEDGKSVGFVVEGTTAAYNGYVRVRDNAFAVHGTDAVVHFIYNPSLYRKDLIVNDVNGDSPYEILEGDPPFINAYVPSQILSLLEDALVANRVTRSALVRILQLEVGDCSPQEEDRALDKLQRGLEQKLAMSTYTGQTQSYADPGPLEKIIYTATRNGKGAINLQTLGGDVNVRDIADLDYFKDKITTITDVSPGNLGQSVGEEGSGGATILTQNNIRLYRKIVTLQYSYASGIRHALNLYFKKNGLLDYEGRFKVKMQKPLGPEDVIKSQLASEALTRANDILAVLDTLGVIDSRVKIEAIHEQLNNIDANLYSIISAEPIVAPVGGEGDADSSPI